MNNFKLSSLLSPKESLPTELRSNIVYMFQCGVCNDSYIGQSSKTAKFRWYQHLGISIRTDRRLGKIDPSQARKHAEDSGHPITVDNFRILDQSKDNKDLKLLESLHIHVNKPPLNIATCSVPLSIVQ